MRGDNGREVNRIQTLNAVARIAASALIALALVACGGADAPPQRIQTAEALLRVVAEWDDEPGPETITLYADGRLQVGDSLGRAEVTTPSDYFFEEQAAIEVVRLGDSKHARAILVTLPRSNEDVDPPNRYQIFVAERNRLRRVFNKELGVYGVVKLTFDGNGTAQYQEDGYIACGRIGARWDLPTVAQPELVTLGLEGGTMREIRREPSGETQECNKLPACPFVYVIAGEKPVLVGEILRNVRGREAYTTQSLRLPPVKSRPLRLRIAEEKPEITYLDAVWMSVDGARVSPRECKVDAPPGWCEVDGKPFRLVEGQAIELTFDAMGEHLELIATGYYVPTPTLKQRHEVD